MNRATLVGFVVLLLAAAAALVLARPERVPIVLAPPARSSASLAAITKDGGAAVVEQTDTSEVESEEPNHGYTITRQDLESAMLKVHARAYACKEDGLTPEVQVKLVIAPTGAVTSVVLPAELRGTRGGDCIAHALRSASFPAYKLPPNPPIPAVEWTYVFRFDPTE